MICIPSYRVTSSSFCSLTRDRPFSVPPKLGVGTRHRLESPREALWLCDLRRPPSCTELCGAKPASGAECQGAAGGQAGKLLFCPNCPSKNGGLKGFGSTPSAGCHDDNGPGPGPRPAQGPTSFSVEMAFTVGFNMWWMNNLVFIPVERT